MSKHNNNFHILTPSEAADLAQMPVPKYSDPWWNEQLELKPGTLSAKALGFLRGFVPDIETWPNDLLIAIPCAELAYSRFWQKLMLIKGWGWHIHKGRVITISGSYIQDAHNKVVREALANHSYWKYLVWLEHDHEFPTNTLELFGHTDKPVVGGLYFNRQPEDPQPVAYVWDEGRSGIKRLQPYQIAPMLKDPGEYQIDVVPMGCTAIRRDVFETWPKDRPFYSIPTSVINNESMSDDVYFCRMAQDDGWPIHIDSRIQPTHLGLVPFNAQLYVAWVEQQKKVPGHTGDVSDKVAK